VLAPVGCIQGTDHDLAFCAAGMDHLIVANVDANMGVRLSRGIEEQ
jgi:hypothetical protein